MNGGKGMKTIRQILVSSLLAFVAFAAGPLFAADSPLLGVWQTESDTPVGKAAATYTFTQADGVLKLAIEETGIESKVSDLKVEGNKFSFKREIAFGGGGLTLMYTGTISGNEFTAVGTAEGVEVKTTGKRPAK